MIYLGVWHLLALVLNGQPILASSGLNAGNGTAVQTAPQEATPRPSVASPIIWVGSRVSPDRHDLDVAMQKRADIFRRVDTLVKEGRYEVAYQVMVAFCPRITVLSGCDRLVLTGLLAGHYEDVERIIKQFDKEHPNEGHGSFLIQLSIATAMQGRVHDGQDRYSIAKLKERAGGMNPSLGEFGNLQLPLDAKSVAIASILATGYKIQEPFSTAYFDWAFKLNPRSTLAAKGLINNFELEGTYSEVRRIAALMLNRLPSGKERDSFGVVLQTYMEMKDVSRGAVSNSTVRP